MSIAQPLAATPVLPDRSFRLMLFGIFQIVLGGLCGLMGLMMFAVTALGPAARAPQGQAMDAQSMIPAMAFYVVLAVGFIWLGIGSVKARRWAWTLTVVFSWMWLIMGVLAFAAFVVFVGPMMSAAMPQQANVPPEALAMTIVMIRIISGAVVAGIYVLLPAIFLIFCQRESVRATCQRRDPKTRWTDRCPMPVLALSILLAFSVVSMPSAMVYGPVVPLFGIFASGPAGWAVILLVTLVMAYLAWGAYRLQMAAWWGMLLLCIVGAVNMAVTFSQRDVMEMYEAMRIPAAQLEMMRKSGMIEMMSRWMPWMGLVGGAVWLGYLLYVRRYFVRNAAEAFGDNRASAIHPVDKGAPNN
jgi:hypothetical protein